MEKNILIIGLGNPGRNFQNTPHNIGFQTINSLRLAINGFSDWQMNKKLKALVAEIQAPRKIDHGQWSKIILAKPQTFMNNSGDAVGAIKNFYKIPLENIWIIHDDLDMELGKIRIKYNSSSGGHKGVESVINKLNSKNFYRIKVGVRGQVEKNKKIDAEKFVLKKFTNQERIVIKKAQDEAINLLKKLLLL